MEIFLSNFATFWQPYWSLSLNVRSSLFFVFLFGCWTCRQNNERTGGQGKTGDLSMTGVVRFDPLRDHTPLAFELIYRVRWKRVRLWSVQFYPSFCSMKQRGVFYPAGVAPNIRFDVTHFNTWVERGTVSKWLAQEHNTMFSARAWTRTSRFRYEGTGPNKPIKLFG